MRSTRIPRELLGYRVQLESEISWVRRRTGMPVLATRSTDGVRSTVGVSLRFFGSAVRIGMARAFDRREPWRFTFGVGQGL